MNTEHGDYQIHNKKLHFIKHIQTILNTKRKTK